MTLLINHIPHLPSLRPMTTSARSFFSGFLSIFLLFFLHLGCFFFCHDARPSNSAPDQQPPPKTTETSPVTPSGSPATSPLRRCRSLSYPIKSYLNHLLLSFRKTRKEQQQSQNPPPIITPASPLPPIPLSPASSTGKTPSWPDENHNNLSPQASTTISVADSYPCPACGEVLSKPHLLDLHQATKHALSELHHGESGKNIVNIIFHSGWRGKAPIIYRILKIHNTPRTLARFEEYRESLKSRAARQSGKRCGAEDERCVADGNERLSFYCSTVMCALGRESRVSQVPLGACGSQFCSACAIVRHGFSGKQADVDGIAMHATSWAAHASLPEDLEQEFAFLRVRRAMLVCRVVAGRVARGGAAVGEEENGAYDSVVPVGRGGGGRSSFGGEEELLVFNPRAVLPCFVIVYSVGV